MKVPEEVRVRWPRCLIKDKFGFTRTPDPPLLSKTRNRSPEELRDLPSDEPGDSPADSRSCIPFLSFRIFVLGTGRARIVAIVRDARKILSDGAKHFT